MNYAHVMRSTSHHGKGIISNMSKRLSTCPPYSKEVHLDEKKKHFYLTIDGERAFIKYKKLNGVFDLIHTEVPERCQGHGVAGALAKGTFELIRKKELQMKLTCDYLQSYYKKNASQELKSLLIEEQRSSLY